MDVKESEEYYYDEQAAERVIAFIQRHVKHIKGEKGGKPFLLEPFQKKIIRDLFGWKHKDTGLRRFRTAYICLPRKNGKSTLVSAIALYMLIADGEKSAECIIAAGDRQQAGIIFDVASDMCRIDPKLAEHTKVYKSSIMHEKSLSSLKAISSEASTKFGYNCSFIAVDEYFIQKDTALVDALTTSVAARTQPLTIFITTAGYDKESPCYKTQQYGEKVEEGIIKDDTFYNCVFKAPDDMDFMSEEAWRLANPALESGVVKIDYLRNEAAKADKVVSYENTFRMLHLNQWVSNESKWLSDKQWNACDISPARLEDFRGQPCYAGLDLASVRDLSAFVLIFPEDDRYTVIPIFFAPKDTAFVRSRRDGVDYIGWAKEGYMELTDGDVTDYNFIKAKILEIAEIVNLKEIAYDRWNSSQLIIDLADKLGEDRLTPYGQGFASLSTPCKELERLVLAKQINHAGHPVLRWNVSNISIKSDPAGNIKFDKSKSTEKIDGAVALVMALGNYLNNGGGEESNYDDRGIIFL